MNRESDFTTLQWRKSSYSGGANACVELATLGNAQWRKSTYSGGANNCVELADLTCHIAVRDSKDPSRPPILLPRAALATFLTAIRTDALDPRA